MLVINMGYLCLSFSLDPLRQICSLCNHICNTLRALRLSNRTSIALVYFNGEKPGCNCLSRLCFKSGKSILNVSWSIINRSATTLKPLTGEVNNIDFIVTMAPVKGWDILGSKWSVRFWISLFGSRRNGQVKRSEWLWQGLRVHLDNSDVVKTKRFSFVFLKSFVHRLQCTMCWTKQIWYL